MLLTYVDITEQNNFFRKIHKLLSGNPEYIALWDFGDIDDVLD